MPALLVGDRGSKKRKRKSAQSDQRSEDDSVERESEDFQAECANILLLETRILESRKYYNDIATLLALLQRPDSAEKVKENISISLCRIFSSLMAMGHMAKTKSTQNNEIIIVNWLKERYSEYIGVLLSVLKGGSLDKQRTTLALLMQLVKDEGSLAMQKGETTFPIRLLKAILDAILHSEHTTQIRGEFVNQYANKYDDIRFYTLSNIRDILKENSSTPTASTSIPNALALLAALQGMPATKEEITSFYTMAPATKKSSLKSLVAHKKHTQEAWLALMRSGLNNEQRKEVLGLIGDQIAPHIIDAELLMDFLTDCYNIGGSMSLLALSGIFYMIQEKNLDYPSFYNKLYSLLDAGVLHSRHRSRFLRLLDTFLSSTHLPAAMVASFIKRLSRLSLFAPPTAIIAIVPYVYNLFKNHPSCTFMIHRVLPKFDKDGLSGPDLGVDPFDMDEEDPMETNAIESSIWEIHTLQSHYHPNVATVANIISEQFTKQAYNLEDFLDYSYSMMLDGELSKDLKKPPVVEYEIPKKILDKNDSEDSTENNLLVKLWNF